MGVISTSLLWVNVCLCVRFLVVSMSFCSSFYMCIYMLMYLSVYLFACTCTHKSTYLRISSICLTKQKDGPPTGFFPRHHLRAKWAFPAVRLWAAGHFPTPGHARAGISDLLFCTRGYSRTGASAHICEEEIRAYTGLLWIFLFYMTHLPLPWH